MPNGVQLAFAGVLMSRRGVTLRRADLAVLLGVLAGLGWIAHTIAGGS